jgi:hypothetical protein
MSITSRNYQPLRMLGICLVGLLLLSGCKSSSLDATGTAVLLAGDRDLTAMWESSENGVAALGGKSCLHRALTSR